jgi:rhodanese-related sulfurtransferase
VTADELAVLLARGEVALLDVRTQAEFEGESDDLQSAAGDAAALRGLLIARGVDPDARVVAYCHSGQRSEIAAALLRSAGVEAVNYPGSWHEWSRRSE